MTALGYSTAYEWQVRANNDSGVPTYADGGTEWSFTTQAAPAAWTTVTSENFEDTIPKADGPEMISGAYDGGIL